MVFVLIYLRVGVGIHPNLHLAIKVLARRSFERICHPYYYFNGSNDGVKLRAPRVSLNDLLALDKKN
jgi:hypothetical protein